MNRSILIAILMLSMFGAVDSTFASGDHHHASEENENIGPGKGIVKASKEHGIQISPEAERNFDIKRVDVKSVGNIELPKSAIVTAGEEVNLFRYRDGQYKRIDFVYVSKQATTVIVRSSDLKPGDQVVVHGNGLLRIAEIAAFGGAPADHH